MNGTFDPCGRKEYVYRFSNMCRLTDGSYLPLQDETEKIFVNTEGSAGKVTQEFKNLMKLIMANEASDDFTVKVSPLDRRHAFRYAKCARQTFIL